LAQLVRLFGLKAARAFYYWMVGICAGSSVFVGDVNLDRFQRWLWSTPQEQREVLREAPLLAENVQALFVVFEYQMDTQHKVMALRREMLTLPALPEEGY
jgi:hypothetical protein